MELIIWYGVSNKWENTPNWGNLYRQEKRVSKTFQG